MSNQGSDVHPKRAVFFILYVLLILFLVVLSGELNETLWGVLCIVLMACMFLLFPIILV